MHWFEADKKHIVFNVNRHMDSASSIEALQKHCQLYHRNSKWDCHFASTICYFGQLIKTLEGDAKQKFQSSLNKNPDVKKIKEFSKEKFELFKYAPLTTVAVERSFSTLNNIMTDKRTKMSPEILEFSIVNFRL